MLPTRSASDVVFQNFSNEISFLKFLLELSIGTSTLRKILHDAPSPIQLRPMDPPFMLSMGGAGNLCEGSTPFLLVVFATHSILIFKSFIALKLMLIQFNFKVKGNVFMLIQISMSFFRESLQTYRRTSKRLRL